MHQALSHTDIDAAAALLREAQKTGAPCAPIREAHSSATIDDAYAIQLANSRWRESQGATVVGAKIGLTAKAVQKQLGASTNPTSVCCSTIWQCRTATSSPGVVCFSPRSRPRSPSSWRARQIPTG